MDTIPEEYVHIFRLRDKNQVDKAMRNVPQNYAYFLHFLLKHTINAAAVKIETNAIKRISPIINFVGRNATIIKNERISGKLFANLLYYIKTYPYADKIGEQVSCYLLHDVKSIVDEYLSDSYIEGNIDVSYHKLKMSHDYIFMISVATGKRCEGNEVANGFPSSTTVHNIEFTHSNTTLKLEKAEGHLTDIVIKNPSVLSMKDLSDLVTEKTGISNPEIAFIKTDKPCVAEWSDTVITKGFKEYAAYNAPSYYCTVVNQDELT